jgi:hypothetical protein
LSFFTALRANDFHADNDAARKSGVQANLPLQHIAPSFDEG